jgi:hypothetical protein
MARALEAKRFKGARLSTPVTACLRENRIKVSNQDKFAMKAPKMRTYILERTLCFLTGRPDEPNSEAARLEPANSGASPLRSAASKAALRSPDRSGADPPAFAMAGVDPRPLPAARET